MSPSIDQHRAELTELCRRYRVLTLSLFGSAARDDFDAERSDYDFLVHFQALPPGQCADTYFGLLQSLEQLLGRPVDLVVASAIKNPNFRNRSSTRRRCCIRLEPGSTSTTCGRIREIEGLLSSD